MTSHIFRGSNPGAGRMCTRDIIALERVAGPRQAGSLAASLVAGARLPAACGEPRIRARPTVRKTMRMQKRDGSTETSQLVGTQAAT